jgi:hypothetical protein
VARVSGSYEKYVLPTAVGVISSAIWWGITQSWLAATSALVAVIVITAVLWRTLPFLLQMQQLNNSEIEGVYENQAVAEKEIQRLALNARTIDILTIRGLGILGLNDSMLRRQLFDKNNGRKRIRVLLLSPDGVQSPLRAKEVGESSEAFSHGINLAVQRMKELAALDHHDLEVYLYDRQPCWRLISIDQTHFISVFGPQIEGHRSKMYKINGAKRSTLHEALGRMFEEMCATGQRII